VLVTSEYVQSPQFRDAGDLRITGDSISFTLQWGTPVSWAGAIRGDSARGRLHTDHWSGTWAAKRQRPAGG
jgi:hypothetical protein